MSSAVYDLVVSNGHIVDPESGRDGVGNIGITDGKIVEISNAALQGKRSIDASGNIVAPGFIDLHSHGMFTSSGWMQAFDGVTTGLELELGRLPVADFYTATAKEGRPTNYGVSASAIHGRIAAFEGQNPSGDPAWYLDAFANPDWQTKVAADQQVDRIIDLVEEGLKEGGLGIGINAGYAPAIGRKEYYRLAELAKKYEVPTFTHVRYMSAIEPESSFEAIEELIGLSYNPGAHMHICHLNSNSLRDIDSIQEMVSSAMKNGANITVEAYPYGALSAPVGAQFLRGPDWELRMGNIGPGDIEYLGTPLTDQTLADKQKNSPGDVIVCHFLRPEQRQSDADLLAKSVLFPGGAIASDAMPWQTLATKGQAIAIVPDVWPLPDNAYSHPRSAATFARFIKMYVRDQKRISLIEAMRKVSLIPAQIMEKCTPQMSQKGRIKVGADADIVVFDLEKVEDRSTFVKPNQPSSGMNYVIVNGTPLIEKGQLDTTVRPGKPVRRSVVKI